MAAVALSKAAKTEDKTYKEEGDQHLRSIREVTGYRIKARDGEIGHVEDFVVDDESWIMRYLVVDTRNWLPGGKKVLLSPGWAERIDWGREEVSVDLKRGTVEQGPEYHPADAVNREVDTRLYDYYGRPVYWKQGDRAG
jgi:hypothetical protein